MNNGVAREGTRLTVRETEVMSVVKCGLSNKAIGAALGASEQTIKNHVSFIMRRLGAANRAHAVFLALRRGLIGFDDDVWGC